MPALARLRRALLLAVSASPRLAAASAGLLLVEALLPLVNLLVLKRLVDTLVAGARSGRDAAGLLEAVPLAALGAGVVAGLALVRGASSLVAEALGLELAEHVQARIQRKAIELDLASFEGPDYHDQLHRARREGAQRPLRILNGLIQLASGALAAAATLSLLVALEPWLLLGLLPALPLFWLRARHARELFEWRRSSTRTERLAGLYDAMLTAPAFARELRLLDLGGLFESRYRGLRAMLKRERLALARRRLAGDLLAQLGLLGSAGLLLVLGGGRLMRGALSYGGLALFAQAFFRVAAALRQSATALSSLHEDSLFLSSLDEFLERRPRVLDPERPRPLRPGPPKEVVFDAVRFAYPGSEKPALDGVSFALAPGRVTALVGPNGAGKSTLLKLLARLYDPVEGRILLDGVDLRELRLADVRRALAVVCQDFARFPTTVAENVGFGDLQRLDDAQAIAEAARRAEADAFVGSLPNGYATTLGRSLEGGQELSAGQWQRLAIARAYLRDAALLALDEPAGALDAFAEAALVKRLRELAGGRTVLLVSHRFSSVALADRVVVLDEGRVAEQGTHAELLQRSGLYAAMYRAQAALYAPVTRS